MNSLKESDPRKKISFVVGGFPTVSETFILNQIVYLIDAGYEVRIFSTAVNRNLESFHKNVVKYDLLSKTISFNWHDYMPKGYVNRLLKTGYCLLKYFKNPIVFALFESFNFFKYGRSSVNLNQFYKALMAVHFQNEEFLHFHFGTSAVNVLPLLKIGRNLNPKITVTFHGYDSHLYSKEYYKELFSIPNVLYTSNTQFTKQRILKLGAPNDRIAILPVGLDTLQFDEKNQSKPEQEEVFKLLFVGRLIKWKAPILAIKILESLVQTRNVKASLDIVGTGKEFENCQNYVIENNLQGSVHFRNAMGQEEIIELMSHSDVFLYPGIVDEEGNCEAQGLVIQEAQSMKLPVLVSDVGGTPEGVIDNQTGFVLKPNDLDGFVEKLLYLKENPEFRKRMGENGRNFVIQNYDNDVLGKKLVSLYDKLNPTNIVV